MPSCYTLGLAIELISQVQVLKVKVTMVRFEHFIPQREAPGLKFPSSCGSLCQGWDLQGDGAPASPTHFDVVFFPLAGYGVVTSFLGFKLFYM